MANDTVKPAAKTAPVSTIKARVLPNNCYARRENGNSGKTRYAAGSIVEVTAEELAAMPKCLISLTEETRLKAVVAAAPKPTTAGEEMQRMKAAGRAAFAATKAAYGIMAEREAAAKNRPPVQ